MDKTFRLPGDWRTFQDAAREKGVSYQTLRQYVYNHKIPTRKVGFMNVVRMADLVN